MTSYIKIFFLFILFVSCKEDDGLPKPTTNGSNIFACRVDGVIFKPVSTDFKLSAKDVEFYEKGVHIIGRRSTDTAHEDVDIFIKYFKGRGTYILDNDSISYGEYGRRLDSYRTNIDNTGKLIITNYDGSNRILSGTFEFSASAIDKTTSKVVKVSDGRFDLKF